MRLPNFPLNNENDATAIALLLGGEAIAAQRMIVSTVEYGAPMVAVYGLDLFTLQNPYTGERLTEKTGPLYASIQVIAPDADAPDDNARLLAFTEHPTWTPNLDLIAEIPPKGKLEPETYPIATRASRVAYVRENGRYLGHLSNYEVRSWANLKNFRFVPVSNSNYDIEVRITYYG
jgi:hypothetical protein